MKMIGIKSEQMNRLIDELFLFSRLDQGSFLSIGRRWTWRLS